MTEEAARPTRRVRFPLRLKLAILAAALAIVPLAIASWKLVDVNVDTLKAQSRDYQEAITEDVGERVDAELVEAQNGLDGVGKVLADRTLDDAAKLALDHAAIYGADGKLIDRITERTEGIPDSPPALSEALRAEATAREVALGPASATSTEVRVLLVVPVRPGGGDGKVTAYVASAVSLAAIQKRIAFLAKTRYGATDAVFLVDADLKYLAHPELALALGRRSAAGVGILAGMDAGVLKSGTATYGEFPGVDGEAMLGTVKPLTPRPWAVVAQVPRRVAYASLYRMRKIVVSTAIATIVIALLVALLFARALTAPVPRLVAFARDLADRRWDRRLVVSTHDELSLVAGAMSDAAADLEAGEAARQKEAAIRAALEERGRHVRETFGRYLSDEIVATLLESEGGLRLGGEMRRVTILMGDLRGFTALSESLTPERVVSVINNYLEIMTEVIQHYGGTIDEILGDALLVIFGAPILREDDARRAVACAVAMQLAMVRVNAKNQEDGLPTIEMGIGINTGEVVAGNIGSRRRAKYGIVGPNVNLTSRIESYTVGGQILASPATLSGAGADVRVDGRLEVMPKGVRAPIVLSEIGGIGAPFDLALPQLDATLVPLAAPIAARFAIFEGKHLAATSQTCRVIALSEVGAELATAEPPAPFTDVRVELLDAAGRPLASPIQGKIVPRTASGATPSFLLRFTSLPDDAKAILHRPAVS